jgi:chloride channel protein, CIC family
VVGLGGVIDPAVLGVGYDNIRALLAGTMAAGAITTLLWDKALVWVAALSSGTSGGVLAPLLILGGALGALEGHVMPFGDSGFWALLGMTAILGGTMRAPLTATIFAVELTGNTHLLPPLFVASVAGFGFTVLAMPRSILTERIARRGLHLTREYGIDPFNVMRVKEIMTTQVETLPSSMRVEDAIAHFARNDSHKSYPVLDEKGRVIAMVSRADILRWTREGWQTGETLSDLKAETVTAFADELAGVVAERMAETGASRIPVLTRETGKLVGLVARQELLRVRAMALAEEQEREGALALPG